VDVAPLFRAAGDGVKPAATRLKIFRAPEQ
jgi:hypothetical protein